MLKDLRAAPNLLTFLRLCIIPFLVTAVLDAHYRMAFTLFVLAGFSDGLDGLLARLLRQRTLLGQYLDPIADKLLLSTLFLVLMHQGLIPRRVTILVFSRDIGILVVATLLFATTGARDFRPSIWGKANTGVQVIAVTTTLWVAFYPDVLLNFAKKWSLIATFVLTLFSWFHYTLRETRRLGSQEPSRLPVDG